MPGTPATPGAPAAAAAAGAPAPATAGHSSGNVGLSAPLVDSVIGPHKGIEMSRGKMHDDQFLTQVFCKKPENQLLGLQWYSSRACSMSCLAEAPKLGAIPRVFSRTVCVSM